MDSFTRKDLKTLLDERTLPCVSLFMPTHPGGAEQDRIRWRKLLMEAEEGLVKSGQRAPDAKAFLAPGYRLLDDSVFWKNQSNGLAAFLTAHSLKMFRLPLAFEDQSVVANGFYVKPLLPLLTGNGRFFVLALSQNAVRLLQGSRHSAGEIDLKAVPQNLEDARLTHEGKEPFSFYGRRAGEGPGPQAGIFHGHGVGIDDSKEELLHYFQKIDRGIHAFLKEEKAPLILAAVDYLQPIYRRANTYAHLLETGIEGNPDRLSSKELHDQAWPLVKPLFEKAQKRAVDRYHRLAGTDRAAGDLEAVVAGALKGHVETLFVALNSQIWGVFDAASSRIEHHEKTVAGDVDLLELAAAHTLMHGHSVYAVKQEEMPSTSPVAAVFNLPLPKHGKRP